MEAYLDLLLFWFVISFPAGFFLLLTLLGYRHLAKFHEGQSKHWHESSNNFLKHMLGKDKEK